MTAYLSAKLWPGAGMHIHKPKALHGWREFLGEIGVIVCGVLIAIALDQTVEALHHHSEAKEMIRKLREESIENRGLVDRNFGLCRSKLAAVDKGIAAVSAALQAERLPAAPEPLPPTPPFRPADAAWITIRDSALLPIMPKLTVDNYWKLDATAEALQVRNVAAADSLRRLDALIQVAHQRPMDQALANDLLLRLDEFSQVENSYCTMLGYLRDDTEAVLAGKALDTGYILRVSEPPN